MENVKFMMGMELIYETSLEKSPQPYTHPRRPPVRNVGTVGGGAGGMALTHTFQSWDLLYKYNGQLSFTYTNTHVRTHTHTHAHRVHVREICLPPLFFASDSTATALAGARGRFFSWRGGGAKMLICLVIAKI